MPFKRSFRTFRSRSSRFIKRRSNRSRFTSTARKAISAIGKHAVNTVFNYVSRHCHRPIPSRYFVWLEANNYGYAAPGSNGGGFGFQLSTLPFPFNRSGAISTAIPNPVTAIGTADYCGLKNLLQNSSTGTGLWFRYRVWKVDAQISFIPGNVSDQVTVAMASVTDGLNSYSTVVAAGQGPFSRTKQIGTGNSGKDNCLQMSFDMPSIHGLTKAQYAADESVTGSYATVPILEVFANVLWGTTDRVVLANALGIDVKLRAWVELFQPMDVSLIDN